MSPTFGFPGWWACSKTILLNYLAIRASRDYFWEIQRGVEKINSTLLLKTYTESHMLWDQGQKQ